MPRPLGLLSFLLLILFLASGCAPMQRPASYDHEMEEVQDAGVLDALETTATAEPIVMRNALQDIYRQREYKFLWTSEHKVRQMVAVLESAVEFGLLPNDYHLERIRQLIAEMPASPGRLPSATLDLLLSDALLLYVQHRRDGKVKPSDLYPEFNFERDRSGDLPPAELMQGAMDAQDLPAFISAQAPVSDFYEALRKQLVIHLAIAANGGWPSVNPGPALRNNDHDPRVIAIRQRLQVTGDLDPAPVLVADEFDDPLEAAVMRFQLRHGLSADGVVGKDTVAAMNVDVFDRINQLRVSLERLRWLEHNTDWEFVAVNIASFQLAYVQDRAVLWTTRVIVGTPYRRTPVFRSLMTHVEFNPTWTIPPTILREDTLPAIRRDPHYLADHGISVIDATGRKIDPSTIDWNSTGRGFPYSLRQEPGPGNALGRVKFIFPNPYHVYMHDTPRRDLFDQAVRGFSSGCIRIENPFRLVSEVLKNEPDITAAEIKSILASEKTRRVRLAAPVPVWILYLTAVVDASGKAMFFPDIYQRDPAVLGLLNTPSILQH